MTEEITDEELLAYTSEIVSAYVSNNQLKPDELEGVIKSVYKTLGDLYAAEPEGEKLIPAVPIDQSVFPDYIICLEDGKELKMLKRHLNTAYGMSPEEYRERWGLDEEYPMVAPNYAKKRSALAKDIGLGKR